MKIKQLLVDNRMRQRQPVNVAKEGTEAKLYIYDVIEADWGIGALQVIDAMAQIGDVETLHVHINSPGGDVFEGRAIMAALGRFKGKTIAHVDSLCASAATSIALACDEVAMAEGAFFMIHNASCIAWGDKTELRNTADLLEKIEGSIVNDYTKKTGKESQEVIDMMDAETWMTAQEAVKHGFVDRVEEQKEKPKNTWNLAAFDKAPKALTDPPKEQPEETNESATAGFFMTAANSNRLKLAMI